MRALILAAVLTFPQLGQLPCIWNCPEQPSRSEWSQQREREERQDRREQQERAQRFELNPTPSRPATAAEWLR